jgi:2,3-bisphosphoglycerate-independent phosphoglycerate mutase
VAPVLTRSHTAGPVPYVFSQRGGAGAPSGGAVTEFSESAAKAGGKLIGEGYRLMEYFLKG